MPQPIQAGSYTTLFFQQLMLDIMKAQAGAAGASAAGGQLSAAAPAATPTASSANPLSALFGGAQNASLLANQGQLINSLSGANITGSASTSQLSQLSASDPNLFQKIDLGLASTMSMIDTQLASVGIGIGSGLTA